MEEEESEGEDEEFKSAYLQSIYKAFHTRTENKQPRYILFPNINLAETITSILFKVPKAIQGQSEKVSVPLIIIEDKLSQSKPKLRIKRKYVLK